MESNHAMRQKEGIANWQCLLPFIIYNVLSQPVERANKLLVLQYASKCKVKQDEGNCRKCCRPMWSPSCRYICGKHIANDAVSDVPSYKQNHAECRNSHLQGTMLEEPDVHEHNGTRNDENAHHDRTEVEQVLSFRNEPQVIHIHLLQTLEVHEVSDWSTKATNAESKGCKQIKCLDAL